MINNESTSSVSIALKNLNKKQGYFGLFKSMTDFSSGSSLLITAPHTPTISSVTYNVSQISRNQPKQ
jgi:hypothetical protein